MIKKIFLVLFLIFLLNGVSAKFICGEILSSEGVTPSWYDVSVYPYLSSDIVSSCKVDPIGYKYCCDIEYSKGIFDYEWNVGEIFGARIVDIDAGVMAGPVYNPLTSEEYDIFLPMELRKVFQIKYPDKNLIISENDSIKLSFNVFDDCDLYFNDNVVCEAGCDYLGNYQIVEGKNNLSFVAKCGDYEFAKDIIFQKIENVSLEKIYDSRIKNNELSEVIINLETSSSVEGIEFREYVPVEFVISEISNEGVVEVSSSNYNVIIWNLTGEEFSLSYSINPSEVGDYYFKSEIEGNDLEEDFVEVYNFVPSFSSGSSSGKGSSGGGYSYEPENVSKVSPTLPLVAQNKEGNLVAAFYSKVFKEDGAFELFNFSYDGKLPSRWYKYLDSYYIESNLRSEIAGEMAFEYSVNKTDLKEKGLTNVEMYGVDRKGDMFRLTGNVVFEEFDASKYSFSSNRSLMQILIFGVKEKLNIWDKIMIWFEGLF